MPLSHRAARTHLDAPRCSKYFLRRRSAGSVSPGIWPTGSPCSATARCFAANPSDPTSRWAPCPARPEPRTSRPEAGNETTSCRWRALIPAVSCAGAHVPSPGAILSCTFSPSLNSSHAQQGITPAFGYGPRLENGPAGLSPARNMRRPAHTTAASDAHPARCPLPGLAGYRARRSGGVRRPPGRGGPPQFPSSLSVRSAPHTPGSP
jgi:hypothetical protein